MKDEILNKIKNVVPVKGNNSMGTSENWYNSYFALKQCFSEDELSKMSEVELNNLIKLADLLSEAFY